MPGGRIGSRSKPVIIVHCGPSPDRAANGTQDSRIFGKTFGRSGGSISRTGDSELNRYCSETAFVKYGRFVKGL